MLLKCRFNMIINNQMYTKKSYYFRKRMPVSVMMKVAFAESTPEVSAGDTAVAAKALEVTASGTVGSPAGMIEVIAEVKKALCNNFFFCFNE